MVQTGVATATKEKHASHHLLDEAILDVEEIGLSDGANLNAQSCRQIYSPLSNLFPS